MGIYLGDSAMVLLPTRYTSFLDATDHRRLRTSQSIRLGSLLNKRLKQDEM